MLKIPLLNKLVYELGKMPGIGPKTAQRLAYHLLKNSPEESKNLADTLAHLHDNVKQCPECHNFTDQVVCYYCQDNGRPDDVICVVEEPSDIMRIESSGAFHGRYHVLHGSISPLDGVSPEDLKINSLMDRIERSQGRVLELILALDSDIEGDTTVLYLMKLLSGSGIKLSRIAQGIPIGSDIDYIDDRTMSRALENRIEL
jgi:recombination protein RecR